MPSLQIKKGGGGNLTLGGYKQVLTFVVQYARFAVLPNSTHKPSNITTSSVYSYISLLIAVDV